MIDSKTVIDRIKLSESDDVDVVARSLESGNFMAFGKHAVDFFDELKAIKKKPVVVKAELEGAVRLYIKMIVDEFNGSIYTP